MAKQEKKATVPNVVKKGDVQQLKGVDTAPMPQAMAPVPETVGTENTVPQTEVSNAPETGAPEAKEGDLFPLVALVIITEDKQVHTIFSGGAWSGKWREAASNAIRREYRTWGDSLRRALNMHKKSIEEQLRAQNEVVLAKTLADFQARADAAVQGAMTDA